MLAHIIPAIKLPRKTDYFTYSVPFDMQKKIKIGQIVQISFRNKHIQGVVIKIKKNKKTPYPLKSITKILFPNILIAPEQIKLISHISKKYGVASSIVAKSILPAIPKRIKDIKSNKKIINNKNKKYIKKILWYENEQQVWGELKKKIKKQQGQILILVPEIDLIDKIAKKLKLKEKDYIKNDSKIAIGKNFKNWLTILSSKKQIIIGTKISVLLPFSNLEKIIIFDSHNWNHKQSNINPRFDAREIAEWLAKQHKCQLTLITPAPQVEEYKNAKITKYLNTSKNSIIKLIDLKQEKFKGNYTFLSDELIFRIENLLQENLSNQNKKNKILIFHNRKGLANYIFCKDCKYIFKCPECQISLVYHTTDKKLHCHHCNYVEDVIPLCPQCSGPNIEFKGQGVEKIKSELQQEFKTAKILVLEKTKIKEKINTKNFDIVIGTEYIINKINFDKFNLIAFTNFDQLLNRPDYKTQEKAYQLLSKIKSQTPNSNILIQTSEPENIVLKSIIFNTPEKFYKTELKNRKLLHYPPFVKIIKLFHLNDTEKKAFNTTQKIVLELKKIFKKEIEILGPFENYPKKIRGKYKYNIILKIPLNFDTTKIFSLIPNNFIIDVNPENLN